MAYKIVQSKVASLSGGPFTQTTVTMNSGFTQGNLFVVNVWQFAASLATITNIQDQSDRDIPFTLVGSGTSTTSHHLLFAICENVRNNITSVKITFGTSVSSVDTQIIEFSGLRSFGALHSFSYQSQLSVASGTDAISSGVASVTAFPALVLGLTRNASGGLASTIGTGYTDIGEALSLGDSEHKRIAATGDVSATFTPYQSGQDHITGVIVLLESEDTLKSSTDILNKSGYKYPIIRTGTSDASGSAMRLYWDQGGCIVPGPGTINSTIGGAVLAKTTAGALPFENFNPGQSAKLSYMSLFSDVPSIFLFIDILWQCSVTSAGTVFDITSTATQTINSVAWPPRDDNGSINGEGVYIAVISRGGWSAGTVTFSINYTNSKGVANRTGLDPSYANNPINARYEPFSLQAGDTGVRSVQTLTLTSTTATFGTFYLIAFRPIALVTHLDSLNYGVLDHKSYPLTSMYNDSCLATLIGGQPSAQRGFPFTGFIQYAVG